MKLTNVRTGEVMERIERFEYEKDAFRKGEYSIYKVVSVNGERRSSMYYFGVSKLYEARAIVARLNQEIK